MKKRMIVIALIVTMTCKLTIYAADGDTQVAAVTEAVLQDGLTLTVDQAVEKGLSNSNSLNKVKNQAEIAALISKNAGENKIDIYNAENDLIEAMSQINEGRSTIYSSLGQLDSAQAALNNGLAPQDIPIPNGAGGTIVIPKGATIPNQAIKDSVQNQLNTNKTKLNGALANLDESTQRYVSSKSKYDLSLEFAMTSVANKLSTSTISSLNPKPLADLIVEMSDIQDRVTSYSINVYKNKIALQIQNSYYEALKQEKLLAVKEKAMQRAQLQYEYASYAYEVGAKSKDDMNLAKLYYDGTIMAHELQVKDYNNALIELKKNLNMRLGDKINLVEAEMVPQIKFDLSQGISSGLVTRLELKMADAQVELYKDLRSALKASTFDEDDNEYKEANLLLKKAEIELADTKLQVESGIRMSYETITAMGKIVATASQLKEGAEETVEIAKLKYEVGFGADNSLLKSLNLQDISGTMVEVIAAEENLASIESKVIESTNGYNLAKLKYLNDIGILPYK